MSELISSEETKKSVSHYLTKTTELNLQKRQVRYIVSANGKTQISNGQEISNNHEETDMLIIHTIGQMKSISCNVIVHVTDTDVFFVLLKRYKVVLCRNFYISLRGFVNITALSEEHCNIISSEPSINYEHG